MIRKRGRPAKNDDRLLRAVARLLVQGKAPSRHAAMLQTVAREYPDLTERQLRSTIRRLERKWVDQELGEEFEAQAERQLARERTPAAPLGYSVADMLAAGGYLADTSGLLRDVERLAPLREEALRVAGLVPEPAAFDELRQTARQINDAVNDAQATGVLGHVNQMAELLLQNRRMFEDNGVKTLLEEAEERSRLFPGAPARLGP